MILADTSAWIEYLRDTGSAACEALDRQLRADELAVTGPIVMEVLAGGRSEHHVGQLGGLLGRARLVPCLSSDFLDAAALYRHCRQQGETVRRLMDCLIAAVAIRSGAALLHHDRDFDVLSRHSRLEIHPAEPA